MLKLKVNPTKLDAVYNLTNLANLTNTAPTTTVPPTNIENLEIVSSDKITTTTQHPNQYWCFWDRHEFQHQPIQCPISYGSAIITNKCISHQTSDVYYIYNEMPDTYKKNVKNLDPIVDYKKSYYETDGVFCSFECCKAFIEDNVLDPKYSDSMFLLNKMYMDMYGIPPKNLKTAPHWRLLKEYGGNFDIDLFRQHGDFEMIKNVAMPECLPLSKIYKEI